MKTWEFGLDEEPFAAVVAGTKTVECRLKRDKFAQFAVGDTVRVRRDYRDENGVVHDGQPDAARVEIVAIREYANFLELIKAEGVERMSYMRAPIEEVADSFGLYYSPEDQARHGVLAIELRVI